MPDGPFISGKTDSGERKVPFQVLCVGMCRTGTQCELIYVSYTLLHIASYDSTYYPVTT